MLFRYVTRILHVAISGRALSGWTFPDRDVSGPTVQAFLHDSNRELYQNLAQTLFRKIDLPALHQISRLVNFRDGMIASFLMHLDSFQAAAPKNDPILIHLHKCAAECGIRRDQLLEWGKMIRVRFEAENSASQVDAHSPESMAVCLEKTATNVIDLQEKMKQQQVEYLGKIEELEKKVDK